MDESKLPQQYRPLSAWAYFGYSLLFSIPLVGFILLIVFALSNDNINRRNYARSYFVAILFGFIIGFIMLVILLIFGGLAAIVSNM